MATSTVPAARLWLMSQIAANAAFVTAGASVSNGKPGKNHNDNHVMVGKVLRSVKAHAMIGSMGTGALEESYTIEVLVSSFQGGEDPDEVAYATMSTLVDAVVSVVRSDPTMGGNVLRAAPLQDEDLGDGPEWTQTPNVGRIAEKSVSIQARAII